MSEQEPADNPRPSEDGEGRSPAGLCAKLLQCFRGPSEDSSLSPTDQVFQRFLQDHKDPELLQGFHALLTKHLLTENNDGHTPVEQAFRHTLQVLNVESDAIPDGPKEQALAKVNRNTNILGEIEEILTHEQEKQEVTEKKVYQKFSLLQQGLPSEIKSLLVDFLDEEGLYKLEESSMMNTGSKTEQKKQWEKLNEERWYTYCDGLDELQPREKGTMFGKASTLARSVEEEVEEACSWPKRFFELPQMEDSSCVYFCRLTLQRTNQSPLVVEGLANPEKYHGTDPHGIQGEFDWRCWFHGPHWGAPSSLFAGDRSDPDRAHRSHKHIRLQFPLCSKTSMISREIKAFENSIRPEQCGPPGTPAAFQHLKSFGDRLSLTVVAAWPRSGKRELVVSTAGYHDWFDGFGGQARLYRLPRDMAETDDYCRARVSLAHQAQDDELWITYETWNATWFVRTEEAEPNNEPNN